VTATHFPGNEDERYRLAMATAHNCTCEASPDGIAGPECPVHALLADEELTKHLVFGARRAAEMLEGEFKA
jgi:hypothetical protein